MFKGKARSITISLLAAYTALMLYFLYFGFDRTSHIDNAGYMFNFIPSEIPLYSPIGKDLHIWFFNFANFAAFIPYGIFIPMLFRCSFLRFISIFCISILVLEAIQMVTHLGSFDIDDVLTNTLGAAIGFCAQKLVARSKDTVKGMSKIFIIAILLSISTIVLVEGMNNFLKDASKVEAGREIGLHELTLKDGSVSWDENLTSFEVAHQKVEPKINLYSRENPGTNTFTLQLDGKYLKISGYSAIPDDVSHGASTITFILDGKEIDTSSYAVNGAERSNENYFETDIQGAKELTVKIINEDENPNTNVLLWDVTLTEIKN